MMTKPSIIFFGFDDVPRRPAKIFFRTLLYSTAIRGLVIERLFLKVRRTGSPMSTTFGFWGHGETGSLSPGSGLFVPTTGIVTNHHFNPRADEAAFAFSADTYIIEVYAIPAGRSPIKLSEVTVCICSGDQETALKRKGGVLYEADPVTGFFIGSVRDGS